MNSKKVMDVEVKDTPHKVDVRPLSDSEHAQIVHIELKPGESLKRHITPVDAAFYILEGTPTIEVAEVAEIHEKDTLIESPAGIVHCISNNSKSPARILVIKTPRPTKATQIL